MRASVIVPLYNKAAHIVRCLESIARQTYCDFEVLVVDDGSTDGSGDLAREFRDFRFRVLTQENGGPGSARNRGASEASGEVLAFLDADDEWLPEYLSINIETLREAGASIAAATCGYLESGINLEPMWRARGLRDGIFTLSADTPPILMVHMVAFMSPWNTVIRTEAFRRLGGFYGKTRALYSEDAWLWAQVLLNYSVSLRFEPVLALFHREVSELSANRRGVRPIEPFLLEPGPLRENCPAEQREMLHAFLAIRTFKTSCALGYWGKSSEARKLFFRFAAPGDWRLPFFWPALACCTPLAGILGKAWRSVGHGVAISDADRARMKRPGSNGTSSFNRD